MSARQDRERRRAQLVGRCRVQRIKLSVDAPPVLEMAESIDHWLNKLQRYRRIAAVAVPVVALIAARRPGRLSAWLQRAGVMTSLLSPYLLLGFNFFKFAKRG
jgi:hypothetical protein